MDIYLSSEPPYSNITINITICSTLNQHIQKVRCRSSSISMKHYTNMTKVGAKIDS